MDDQAQGGQAGAAQDRRAAILNAAEACFARTGFHRTTMQDIAGEAGMSVGNLYRYFANKDAVIIALGERDRTEMAQDFRQLEGVDDFLACFRALGEKHLRIAPASRTAICLEIWAEATRNAVFAEITRAFELEMLGGLERAFALAQARGAIRSTANPRALAVTIGTIADGLFVRRAVSQTFDPDAEIEGALALIGAVLNGAIDCAAVAPPVPAPSVSEPVAIAPSAAAPTPGNVSRGPL